MQEKYNKWSKKNNKEVSLMLLKGFLVVMIKIKNQRKFQGKLFRFRKESHLI